MKCVPFAVNVCLCEMLFLTCSEHTSTMLPVNESQDYDHYHQVKGADQIWSVRDAMCRIESQKMCTMYMHAYVKCSSSHAQNTLQPRHQLAKLRIMMISTKKLIKYGNSEIICVELRAKKL